MLVALCPSEVLRASTMNSISTIQSALAGGAATCDFFQTRDLIYGLSQAIAASPQNWQVLTNPQTQQPMCVYESDGAQLFITPLIQTDVLLGNTPPSGTFQWNGNSYNLVGSTQIQFSANGYEWVTNVLVGTTTFLASDSLLPSFFTLLLQQMAAGGGAGAGQLAGAFEEGVAIETGAADAAATDAVVGVVEIGEVAAMAGCFLGFVGAVAILYLVMDFILHTTVHRITVINLTDWPITWSFPFTYEGSPTSLPSQPAGTSPDSGYVVNTVLPGGQSSGPDNLKPVFVYSDAEFQYTSDDTTGLGYVMRFAFMDGNTQASYAPVCMFDLPFSGDNSLACTFDGVDASAWYYENQGANKIQSYSAMSADGKYSITVTYDFLDDEHPDPSGQNTGYYYNSLVVIQQS